MGSFFVNPGMLGLFALVAAPIIIYLINRQRYRRRRWATMEFLLRALRKNQRRLQLQNLLLLLIRILIVLLLVLAIARPVLRRSPLGVTPGGQQNWVLVLDTSFSMDYRAGGLSLFDAARSTLTRMIGTRDVGDLGGGTSIVQAGDSLALVTLAYDPDVLVERSVVTPDLRARVGREIEDVPVSYRPVRLVPSLRAIEDAVAGFTTPTGDPEPCRIVLFSDLQRRDWIDDEGPLSPEIRSTIDRLRARGAEISIAELSGEERKLNVAVTDLSMRPELVARGVPVRFSATLANLSELDAENLDFTIRVQPAGEITPDAEAATAAQMGEVVRVAAGDSTTRMLSYRFDEPGFYAVTAEVRSDGLVIDNRRSLVVNVEEDVGVLIVDGDPAVDRAERETFYLEFALRATDDDVGPADARYSPFLPISMTTDQLDEVDWRQFQIAILANVDEVPKAALPGLERFVAEGGALIVFLGDNVRPSHYNDALYRGGRGLLPHRLVDVRGDRSTPVYLQFTSPNHPLGRYFTEQKDRSYLFGGVVSFYRYWSLDPSEPPESEPGPEDDPNAVEEPEPIVTDVDVIARFGDLDRNPAILDNGYGRGRVIWVTSSADREWNEFPVWQDFVVFLYEAVSYLVGFGSKTLNLEVGVPFVRHYESDDFASEVMLTVPPTGDDEFGPGVVRRSMRETEDAGRFQIAHEDTFVPGIYTLDLRRVRADGDESRRELFSVHVDAFEGDLRPLTRDDFLDHFELDPERFDASERFRDLAKEKDLLRGREYWKWCLAAVLALLLLETALGSVLRKEVPMNSDAVTPLVGQTDTSVVEEAFRWLGMPDLWVVVLIIVPAVVLFSAFFYRREILVGRDGFRWPLAALRALLLLFVLGMMAQPVRRKTTYETRDSTILVLIDESLSMDLADRYSQRDIPLALADFFRSSPETVESTTRYDLVRRLFRDEDLAFVEKLREKGKVVVSTFARTVHERAKFGRLRDGESSDEDGGVAAIDGPADAGGEDSAAALDGEWLDSYDTIRGDSRVQETRIADSLRDAVTGIVGSGFGDEKERVSSIVLLTDGQENAGSASAADVARRLGERGTPIHVIGVGNPDEPKDIRLVHLDVEEVVLVGDDVAIDVTIIADGFEGERVPLELKIDSDLVDSRFVHLDGGGKRQIVRPRP